jgi:hypothetical protein
MPASDARKPVTVLFADLAGLEPGDLSGLPLAP